MKRVFSVYRITNAVNGKVYIGITARDPVMRWWGHRNAAKADGGFALHQAIRKHGENNFKFEVICCTKDKNDLKYLEILLIKDHDSHCFTGHGYNMTEGGDGTSCIGNSPAREVSTGNSLGRVSLDDPRWSSGEIVSSSLGHKVSPESRLKISEAALANSKGALNANARLFKLTSPSGVERVLSGVVHQFCKDNKLKYSALYDYIDKGPVPPPSKYHMARASEERLNTVGWKLEKLNRGEIVCQA